MKPSLPPKMKIRELDRDAADEINLVARRMRDTLIEVLGEEKGTALYSMDWLVNRVLWHLDENQTTAKIFLIEGDDGQILGHAIARIDQDKNGTDYGYFSTLFVQMTFRGQGLADALVHEVVTWFRDLRMAKVIYNTAENHTKILRLLSRHGFHITDRHSNMVQLTKIM